MITAKKILLIEDDEDDQYLFCAALRRIHPLVLYDIANNGQEALNMLEVSPLYDLIFMDLNMPRMNGFECLECLKSKEGVKHIPVIVISTTNRPADINKCERLGAATFFPKPTNFNELFEKLQHILTIGVSFR